MKNYVREEGTILVAAPSGGAVSGQGYVVGAMFGVAQSTAAQGVNVPLRTLGVIDLPKAATITFTQGEKVFWDNAAKAIKKTATGFFQIGVATVAAAANDPTIRVRLDGIAVTAVP